MNTAIPSKPVPRTASLIAQNVIAYGLELYNRVQQGSAVNLTREQNVLKDMLLCDASIGGGDDAKDRGYEGLVINRPAASNYLGVRYALVCWLDELFTVHSTWEKEWNEHKLEVELYGSNDRAWRFWEQAKLAQGRTDSSDLEAYYLCVMLGFRGSFIDSPEKLQAWSAATRQRLGNVVEPDWEVAGELPVPTRVPPLRGAGKLRQMALTAWVAVLVITPLTAFYLMHRLGQ